MTISEGELTADRIHNLVEREMCGAKTNGGREQAVATAIDELVRGLGFVPRLARHAGVAEESGIEIELEALSALLKKSHAEGFADGIGWLSQISARTEGIVVVVDGPWTTKG